MPIDIFAGLKKFSRTSKSGRVSSKVAIEITAGELIFDPMDKATSADVANAIRDAFRAGLMHGAGPDGSPLPPIDQDTKRWREFDEELGARGGQAAERITNKKKRAEVKRKYNRDYSAPRLGTFVPKANGPRGNVSGMLRESFLTRPGRDGKSFITYVAAKRGTPRPGEQLSAVESVFGNAVNNGTIQRLMTSPQMQAVLRKAADRMVANSRAKFLQEAQKAVRNLRQLGGQIQDMGEDGGDKG